MSAKAVRYFSQELECSASEWVGLELPAGEVY